MFIDFIQTPVLRSPELYYASISSLPEVRIPLHVNSYKVGTRNAKLSPVSGLPAFDVSTNSAKGSYQLALGGLELPKIAVGGYIDTPYVTTQGTPPQPIPTRIEEAGNPLSTVAIPNFFWAGPTGPQRMTYADFIAMASEGRSVQFDTAVTHIINPTYYRDPFGRLYNSPRITAFDASLVEGRPCRNIFNMEMELTTGYSV